MALDQSSDQHVKRHVAASCAVRRLSASAISLGAQSFLHTFFFHDAWLHAIFSEYHTLVVRGDIDEDGSSCWYAF